MIIASIDYWSEQEEKAYKQEKPGEEATVIGEYSKY